MSNSTERIHPLHSVDAVCKYMESTGEYFPKERCTGRTTIIALQVIAKAMENPYHEVQMRDHFNSIEAHQRLLDLVRRMVRVLGLSHFVFNQARGTIQFGKGITWRA